MVYLSDYKNKRVHAECVELLRCLKRSSRIALQLSQLRVQCGLRTSKRGLTALLGEVFESISSPELSGGRVKDMSELALAMLSRT
jgi:hypothetical protein